ncbi:unnamed protein product [Paramecium octaurelia]|uniref:Uncharacterized protein n=1 Tax=Paramecium octaurelia TaxID=43137 RepID=A0A8S1VVC9_PAROT|nr:unnamed protein product [Paramecium octaurelia]
MQSNFTIKILPYLNQMVVTTDPDTEIQEMLEYIKSYYDIRSDTKYWTCYSEMKRIFLHHNCGIGIAKDDKLIINTSPNQKQSTPDVDLANSQSFIYSELQYSQNYCQQYLLQNQIQHQSCNKYNSGQQSHLNQSDYIFDTTQFQAPLERWESVIINFEIINGSKKYYLQCTYREDDILNDLAITVLAYLRVSSERASCDLFYSNCSLNNYDTRQQQIRHTRFIESGITLHAQLRWIGLKN